MTEETWTFLVVLAASIATLALLRRLLKPKQEQHAYRNQLVLLGATLAAGIVLLVFLPLPKGKNEQVVTLAGILLSAAVALSSTTFLGNALAGIMLRAIRNFDQGDWVRVGDWFGRVTERELLHTELQTQDRDLVTLPNLALVTQPMKVVRRSGTFVSAEVSLGYDVPHSAVDAPLLAAAAATGLEDAYVSVTELGDFSVSYRVSGLLKDVDRLLSHRSALHRHVLDHLHGAGIEIVSPTFMNTLARAPGEPVVPGAGAAAPARRADGPAPEDVVFDKAGAAGEVAALREGVAALEVRLAEAKKAGADDAELERLGAERERQAARLHALEDELRNGEPREPGA